MDTYKLVLCVLDLRNLLSYGRINQRGSGKINFWNCNAGKKIQWAVALNSHCANQYQVTTQAKVTVNYNFVFLPVLG